MPSQSQFEAGSCTDLLRSFGASVTMREDVQTGDQQTFPEEDDAQYSTEDDQNINACQEERGDDVEQEDEEEDDEDEDFYDDDSNDDGNKRILPKFHLVRTIYSMNTSKMKVGLQIMLSTTQLTLMTLSMTVECGFQMMNCGTQDWSSKYA